MCVNPSNVVDNRHRCSSPTKYLVPKQSIILWMWVFCVLLLWFSMRFFDWLNQRTAAWQLLVIFFIFCAFFSCLIYYRIVFIGTFSLHFFFFFINDVYTSPIYRIFSFAQSYFGLCVLRRTRYNQIINPQEKTKWKLKHFFFRLFDAFKKEIWKNGQRNEYCCAVCIQKKNKKLNFEDYSKFLKNNVKW